MPSVVGIDEGNEIALRVSDPEVAGGVNPRGPLREDRDAVAKSLELARRFVFRSVVDHQQLERSVALVKHALYGPSDAMGAITCRQHD
jgi:hypothetical protein